MAQLLVAAVQAAGPALTGTVMDTVVFWLPSVKPPEGALLVPATV